MVHPVCTLANVSTGPGVFGYYQVAQMQYVMDPKRAVIPPEIAAFGLQPVRIVRQTEPTPLFPSIKPEIPQAEMLRA
ncbi:MAG: hypothetical protein JXA33_21325 [Anaerolineae bacterium]|nr:hypothetical protein [Anaerolineae bacterium]